VPKSVEAGVVADAAVEPALATRFAPLDGVRALAVTAVILYHAVPGWAVGGYFGVDVFFVLSGFLITSLLLGEWRRSGTVALGAFWGRRARRLLPALFLMLTAVGVTAALLPQVLGSPNLFGDTAATLGYVANWHFIAQHSDYFAQVSNPSPLQHTWTLSIEEQFYLVWPLLLLVTFRVLRRRPNGPSPLIAVAAIAAAGAAASAVLMAVLAPTNATASVSRVYYGSDTRAQGLLVGCAVAALCLWWGPVRTAAGRRAVWLLGVAGAVGTIVMWRMVAESSAFTFHGGFAVLALCAAGVIACVTLLPGHPVARALALRPMAYLGRISYGMYLWYWPVLLVMTAGRTHLHGTPLLAGRLLVIVAVAAASYHLVEAPIQRGALSGWRWRAALPTAVLTVALLPLIAPLSGAAASSAAVVVRTSATTTAHPVRILLLGDSMAGSLGVGLSQIAPRYGAEVVNHGTPGCSLAAGEGVRVLTYSDPPGSPCSANDPDKLLAVYRSLVAQYDPDVVLYFARTDTLTNYVDGRWQYFGMPAFDNWAESRYDQAISVLSSQGAHVVFLTSPLYDSGDQLNGSPWPENDPNRVTVDNRLLTQAVEQHPGVAAVVDLGSMLSPGGRFESFVDDVPVRCGDGVHLTVPGGEWVGTKILPQVVPLGREHATTATALSRAPLAAQSPPWWYPKLPCGT
jgi:peptidoglycan/LPS O-acetylase OafA/YrhL